MTKYIVDGKEYETAVNDLMNDYESFKKYYGPVSSWAVWSNPSNEEWRSKDSIGKMNVDWDEKNAPIEDFAKDLFMSKDIKYIFVGLNPSDHPSVLTQEEKKGAVKCDGCKSKEKCELNNKRSVFWTSFHSGCIKKSQDYKLRYAFYIIRPKLRGSFLIDLLEDVDKDGSRVYRRASEKEWSKGINDLLKARKMLGGRAVLVAMGQYVYNIICEYRNNEEYKDRFDGVIVRGIRHFSAPGIEMFVQAIKDLCDDALCEKKPVMYKGNRRVY